MTTEDAPALPGMARQAARRGRRRGPRAASTEPAAHLPVARVLVDVPLAHLDRPFDYLVPAGLDEGVRPGVRVKVRFNRAEVDGYVVERVAESEHQGSLQPLRRLVSPEPVLTDEVARLTQAVAARCAGTRSDVLRLAVPPRHARVEQEERPAAAPAPTVDVAGAAGAWQDHTAGPALVRHLADGGCPRAVWEAAPGSDWAAMLARAALATTASGRGALLCVPDARDVRRLGEALRSLAGEGQHVELVAERGPAARYRDFLRVLRGDVRIVVGTRAAAFAPVTDLGLVALWDDGDDQYAEPRAPYPHTRETLLQRAVLEQTAALVGGFARSVEGEYLLRTGWARSVAAGREVLRDRVRVSVAGGSDHDVQRDPHARSARVPAAVHALLRDGLEHGPVLVQTPRSGYAASLACQRCRTPARCRGCAGPLAQGGAGAAPECRWCGGTEQHWQCQECGHPELRAPVLGERRTAEELGRAFPQVRVVTSSGDRVHDRVAAEPAIVVATPGAEPHADGGYAGVVLLDTWLPLARAGLRAQEEAVRRWVNAIGLIAPGAVVVAVGDASLPALQALVRWDPGGFAARELEDRVQAHLPPASRVATITGSPGAVDDALTLLTLPESAEVLGPVPAPTPRGPGPGADGEAEQRVVVRVPRSAGEELSGALVQLQRSRSARKLEAVRVQVDPYDL